MSDTQSFWRFAQQHRERIAIVDWDGSVLTFGQVVDEVNQLSRAMQQRGLGTGDNVALLARNQARFLIAVFAAYQIGCFYTAVNSHLAADEVAYILRDSDAQLLLVDADTAALAAEATRDIESLAAHTFALDAIPGLPGIADLTEKQSADAPPDRVAGGRMLYTSGTSGRPKGVRHVNPPGSTTPEVGLRSLMKLFERFHIEPVDHVGNGVHLVTSPMYHAAPLNAVMAALVLGHRIVIMRRFDALTALQLIERERVTWTQVVPTMMKRWLDLGADILSDVDTSSLRWVIHAGAPCPPDLKRRTVDWLGPVLYEYYASTEGGGTAITTPEWLEHPGSVGRPWDGASIVVMDDDGETLPAGSVGQIYMRMTRPFEYNHDPTKTAGSRRGDFITVGDLGWLDEDGYLFIADRRTDLVISGGVNIYPAEIEAVLLEEDMVEDAAAIGVPHPDLHQVVLAVVQARPGIDLAVLEADLRRRCAARLGSQKQPRDFEFTSHLPRTEAGKLLRRELIDEYLQRTKA